jgi:tripartite ATP-independent transporter DctM subunit
MEWYWALALLFGTILFLMLIGFPVGLAFLVANVVGASYFMGGSGTTMEQIDRGVGILLKNGFDFITSFYIVPIPMFLLMGELFFYTGLANRMFDGIDKLMGKTPGRLSYVTVAGGTAFAALSGSSMGSAALLGTVMVPEMVKRGYKKYMAIGPILGTGGIAILIPPSALGVLLGTLAELDIGALLIAGILPGLILAAMYAVFIYVRVRLDPEAAPTYEVPYIAPLRRLAIFATEVLPMMSVIVAVILLTVGTPVTPKVAPSESAAYGCVGVIVLAAIYRKLNWDSFWRSVEAATRITIMALLIIFGSQTFSAILSFSGASAGLIKWATAFNLDPMVMLLIMFGILLVLGCFMDQLSMMLLTVPIFFPLAKTFGWDPIWFAIIVMMSLEISFTTPPFGLLLFVMQGIAPRGTTFWEICRAAIPYIICAVILVALIVAAPAIATWLPEAIGDYKTEWR